MELVQPIRQRSKIEAMKTYLRGKSLRDYCLFVLGVNSGLRVSDLLSLRISQVTSSTGRIIIRERKTEKLRDFPLGSNSQKAIAEYLATRPNADPDDYLFLSERQKKDGSYSAITREYAWLTLNEAARAVGIKESIGTHTLRKTFGYHAYKQTGDITMIQAILNHASPKVTLRYIGITQDDMDSIILAVNL